MLERFKLGQIVNAVGLKGENKVYPYTDYKERFEELDQLFIEDKVYEIDRVRYQGNLAIVKFKGVDDRNAAEALKGKYLYIDRVRYQGNLAIVKFKGVNDRNAAEALKGKYLYIDRENARPLEEDEYFVPDLVGLKVCSPEGEVYGTLKDVIQNTAQDVYEVQKEDGGVFMIPAVKQFIKNVDIPGGVITVELIEGMLE